jgi:uncharacterized coiled-coil DUF342 family protein
MSDDREMQDLMEAVVGTRLPHKQSLDELAALRAEVAELKGQLTEQHMKYGRLERELMANEEEMAELENDATSLLKRAEEAERKLAELMKEGGE